MAITVVAFAPGRVELSGNPNNYREGLPFAPAIHLGITSGRNCSTLRPSVAPSAGQSSPRPSVCYC